MMRKRMIKHHLSDSIHGRKKVSRLTKTVAVFGISIGVTSCGTFNTALQDESKVGYRMRKEETRCTSIPRMYSGVFYDLCALNSDRSVLRGPYVYNVGTHYAPYIFFDIAFSGVLDTVLLPVTTYTQIKEGNYLIRGSYNPINE